MVIHGFDLDGTLLPLKGKRDNFEGIRDEFRTRLAGGDRCVVLTSRFNVEDGRCRLAREYGIIAEVYGFRRDDPGGKGRWLREALQRAPERHYAILWDDEDFFLSHSVGGRVRCRKINEHGSWSEYRRPPDWKPWVPKGG